MRYYAYQNDRGTWNVEMRYPAIAMVSTIEVNLSEQAAHNLAAELNRLVAEGK